MPNNDNGPQRRNALSGASLVVGAVGVLVGLAAAEHAQAQEEERESVVEGMGRWIRENIFDTPRSAAAAHPAAASHQVRPLARRLTSAEVNILPVRCVSDAADGAGPRDANGNVTADAQATVTADDEKAFCVVCREHYANGDRLLRLPCFHEFHIDCIRDYLETTEGPMCPICRHPVTLS